MSAFSEEQQKEIDDMLAKARADAKTDLASAEAAAAAWYVKVARAYRAWIVANPLPASRVNASVALLVGVAIGIFVAAPVLAHFAGK